MTLTEGESQLIWAAAAAFLVAGAVTGRAALALLPALCAAGFFAATVASDRLYSEIAEDVQITIIVALAVGSASALAGATMRRVVAEELRRRRKARSG